MLVPRRLLVSSTQHHAESFGNHFKKSCLDPKDANLKKKLLPSIYENPESQVEASADPGHSKTEGTNVEKVVIGNKKKKLGKKERLKKDLDGRQMLES